jgi:CheY-like chemotaxis protein
LRRAGYAKPIIALTANAMAGDYEKCLGVGCDGYITKPLDRQRFLSLVAEHARNSSDKTVTIDSDLAEVQV